jgi:hypothetical protein
MITIEKALQDLPTHDKRLYFKWKFGLWFNTTDIKDMTPEEFLEATGKKSFATYKRWERSPEYQNLIYIYLNSRAANDLLEIYEVVSAKAKEGDTKCIDQLIKLQKEIKSNIKSNKKKKTEEVEDDLVI